MNKSKVFLCFLALILFFTPFLEGKDSNKIQWVKSLDKAMKRHNLL